METREYRTMDKSDWGPGPWQDEPDKLQWQDTETGLPCLIVRNNLGALCGYVGVPPGHRLYGKEYDDVDVDVHGGLTFAGPCHPSADESRHICHVPGAGEPDHVYWFGFDCLHGNDFGPGMAASMRKFREEHPVPPEYRDVYRDLNYVRAQVAKLAKQIL